MNLGIGTMLLPVPIADVGGGGDDDDDGNGIMVDVAYAFGCSRVGNVY